MRTVSLINYCIWNWLIILLPSIQRNPIPNSTTKTNDMKYTRKNKNNRIKQGHKDAECKTYSTPEDEFDHHRKSQVAPNTSNMRESSSETKAIVSHPNTTKLTEKYDLNNDSIIRIRKNADKNDSSTEGVLTTLFNLIPCEFK
uniref:Uncharacterized protein n=1 Tax=Heterorhabditis bacteriophora TaxID=37862 RepID=A0A1I7W864_HETBA